MVDPTVEVNLEDPAAMQATIQQLVGMVSSMQGELQRLQSQTPASAAHVPLASPALSSDGDSKLKIPTPKAYDGSQAPGAVENFLFDCDQYFVAKHTPADKQVFFAAALLEGVAKTWWRFLCHKAGAQVDILYDWSTFHAQLLDRFRVVNATRHARDQLADLKQDGSVRSYAQKMQDLALQIPSMQDDELLDRFLRGLKTRTRMEVTMREPQTFEDAVKLADRYDSLFNPGFGFGRQPVPGRAPVARPSIPFTPRFANPPAAGPVPMEIDALKRRNPPLTPQERARLMKVGGCFYCRKERAGHIAPNCPLKPSSQVPRVNQVEREPEAPTEHPDLIDLHSEPRDSENFTPQ